MSRRTLHFAAPGFKTQLIEIAPDAEDPRSKRHEIIKNEDDLLNKNLDDLEEGTKARNRAFQNRLDEVWSQTASWEAKLRTEAREAVETITNMKEEYGDQMDKFLKELLAEVNSTYDKFDLDLIVKENERMATIEADLDVFVKDIVPADIEKHSGVISRQLKKAYEAFDIEAQKEAKREKKFVNRASEHMQNTAQRFNDENALMTACFFQLEEDVVQHERRAARMYAQREDMATTATVALNAESTDESSTREREDIDVLETVIDTQKLLQQTVLEHFSSEGDSSSIGFPALDRLENRMNKQRAKKK